MIRNVARLLWIGLSVSAMLVTARVPAVAQDVKRQETTVPRQGDTRRNDPDGSGIHSTDGGASAVQLICGGTVDARIKAYHQETVVPLQTDLRGYKEELMRATYAGGAVIIVLTALGVTAVSFMVRLKRVEKEFKRDAKILMSDLAAKARAETRLEERRQAVVLRAFRYIVERARSEYGQNERVVGVLNDLYFGLGLVAPEVKEVRKAIKALRQTHTLEACPEWVNEVRAQWEERLDSEDDATLKAEMKELVRLMEDALAEMLHRGEGVAASGA